MSIQEEHQIILRRLKKDSKENITRQARIMRMPYQTLLCLVRGRSLGTIKTWLRIERFYAKQSGKKEIGG